MAVFKEKTIIRTISPKNAFKLIEEHENDSNLVILDIRPINEFESRTYSSGE